MATTGRPPDRNLALELVRVTEAGAMGAGRWIGRGDKNDADQAAVDAMRAVPAPVQMRGGGGGGEGGGPVALQGGGGGEGKRPRRRRRRRSAGGDPPHRAGPAERD